MDVLMSEPDQKTWRPPGVASIRLTRPSPLSYGATPSSCPPNEIRFPRTVTHSGQSNTSCLLPDQPLCRMRSTVAPLLPHLPP